MSSVTSEVSGVAGDSVEAAPYRADIAELLVQLADEDGVVRWSDMHMPYVDEGADGAVRGHAALDIYLPLPEGADGGAPEVWHIMGSVLDYLDDRDYSDHSRYRHLWVGEQSFYTNKSGSQIWVDYDLCAWLVTDPDPNAWYAGIRLAPKGEPLAPERYAELVEMTGKVEGSQFWFLEVWSSELIGEVLAAWAKAFCGLELRFEYAEDTASRPEWARKLEETMKQWEEDNQPTIKGCQGVDIPEGAVPGERGRRCIMRGVQYRNPDGREVCATHKEAGAVLIENL